MLRNFSFIIDDVLAGCAMPGTSGRLSEDLQEACLEGITAVVSLSERPLQRAVLAERGMKYLHLPVEDFTAPTLEQVGEFVQFVDEVRASGGATLTHCHGGIGRTGTMLACYLVKEGLTAREAMEEVRRRRPGSIETDDQEDCIRQYEARLSQKKQA